MTLLTPRQGFVQCLSPAGLHRMAWREWGDPSNPRVLLCVHGLTRVGNDFDRLAGALADRYRVVCPDVVGRGASDWLRDPRHYGMGQYVADMVTLLARLDAALADRLTEACHGREMLERLERGGLFIQPLDSLRRWYSYHPLFAVFLQGELRTHQPQRVNQLHLRAAEALLAEGMPEEAARHAVQAGDPQQVAEILQRHGRAFPRFYGSAGEARMSGGGDRVHFPWKRCAVAERVPTLQDSCRIAGCERECECECACTAGRRFARLRRGG